MPGTRNGVQIRAPRKIWGREVKTCGPGAYIPRDKRSMVKLKFFFLIFEVAKLKFFFLTCQLWRTGKGPLLTIGPAYAWTHKCWVNNSVTLIFLARCALLEHFVSHVGAHKNSAAYRASASSGPVRSRRVESTTLASSPTPVSTARCSSRRTCCRE